MSCLTRTLAACCLIPALCSACFQSSTKHFHDGVEDSDIQENLPDGPMDGGDPGPDVDGMDQADMPDMAEQEPADILDDEVIPGESWLLSLGDEDCLDLAYKVSEIRPGEYFFSGYSYCDSGGWIGKFDDHGRMIWQKRIDSGDRYSYLWVHAVSTDGYIYMAGLLSRAATGDDFWILKLDPDGRILWQGGAGTEDREFISALAACEDGGIVVCGPSKQQGNNTWIMKLAPDGSVPWSKFISYELTMTASAGGWSGILESRDGGIVIARGENTRRGVPLDLWVMKLSGEGSLLWQKVIKGHWNGFATDLVETETGELVIVGGANFLDPDYDYDVWILTLSADGELLRQDTYGGPLDDWAQSVVRTAGGGIIVGGITESYGRGGKDMWLAEYNPAGEIEWQRSIGTAGQDTLYSTLISTTGRLIFAGEGSDGAGENTNIWLGSIGLDGEFTGVCSLIEETHASARSVEVTVEEPVVTIQDYCSALYETDAVVVNREDIPRYLCP